ncbi:MAG: hypothetical protein KF819_33535 [Labilithrix sp.]|nr:hypothetical protein [Labilithrix sp.]
MRRVGLFIASVAGVLVLAWAAGCGDSVGPSEFPDSAAPGEEDGGPTPPPFNPDGGPPPDGGMQACGPGGDCPAGLVCVANKCLPPQGKCNADAGADAGDAGVICQYDTYCDPATGTCLPFGTGKNNDPTCHQLIAPGNFAPKVKCEFPKTVPIAGDAFPNHVEVQATPMVARFGAATVSPSIVVPFTPPLAGNYTEDLGVIRILKGTDCTQEATIGGTDLDGDGLVDWARSSSPVAIADLDGDKLPEIVAYMSSGTNTTTETLMAFTRKSGSWAPLWATKKATQADGVTIFTTTVPAVSQPGGKGNWAGPSIHDLDDDGKPEIIREGFVFDGQTGRLRAGLPPNYASYSVGIPPVLANLDADPKIEMTNGARVWEFDGATNTWVPDPVYNATPSAAGWVAVADFDPYDGTNTPEIVVASNNTLTIYKTDHTVFMGMFQIPVPAQGGAAGGGPPTIADFDGDGLPEVALAGRAFYTVFDPDCQGTPRPGGKCADRTHCDYAAGGACTDYILWSRSTQDISSNVTGSSIFDFEADGKAEVIYADECFTRVYSGTDGRVVFSRYRSSCTWLENPIVADVDGDFRAELVVPSNTACGPVGVGVACTRNIEQTDIDAQFAGLVCLKNTDCVSGNCDQGLCRCATSADCCPDKDVAQCEEFGTKCAAPPAGTPGAGNTCRANHPHGVQGIRVFEDAADRWVRSRSIWNQHAYAVTHVDEDGTIPKTSTWAKNWTQPKLNNFRQNVPGNQNATDIGDFTAQATATYVCDNGKAILSSPICNRGTAPVGSGVSVGFYVGTTKVCGAKTNAPLTVGACEIVTCTWNDAPRAPTNVTVVPNDDNAFAQCNDTNDKGLVAGVVCTAPK